MFIRRTCVSPSWRIRCRKFASIPRDRRNSSHRLSTELHVCGKSTRITPNTACLFLPREACLLPTRKWYLAEGVFMAGLAALKRQGGFGPSEGALTRQCCESAGATAVRYRSSVYEFRYVTIQLIDNLSVVSMCTAENVPWLDNCFRTHRCQCSARLCR